MAHIRQFLENPCFFTAIYRRAIALYRRTLLRYIAVLLRYIAVLYCVISDSTADSTADSTTDCKFETHDQVGPVCVSQYAVNMAPRFHTAAVMGECYIRLLEVYCAVEPTIMTYQLYSGTHLLASL